MSVTLRAEQSTPPSITTAPQATAVVASQPATFTVVAEGTPVLLYQWYYNDCAITGANSATYIRNTVAADNGAQIRVRVYNSFGEVYSDPVTLTVYYAPKSMGCPVGSATYGQPATFTATFSASPAPTYQWYRGSEAIEGATNLSLTFPNVTYDDVGTYRLVATNSYGSAFVMVSIDLPPPPPPVITEQPADTIFLIGGSATLTVKLTTYIAPKYQWYHNGRPIVGATSTTLTITNATITDVGEYRLRITHSSGVVDSTVARLIPRFVAPYLENFDNAGIPSFLPYGWSIAEEGRFSSWYGMKLFDASTSKWQTVMRCYDRNDGSDPESINRFISPSIDLSATPNAQLSFSYFYFIPRDSNPTSGTLRVYYQTQPSGSWTLLAEYKAPTLAWVKRTVLLPSPSATYSVAFDFDGGASGAGLYLDDIRVTAAEAHVPAAITSASEFTFLLEVDNYFAVTTTGTPDAAFSATGLPDWVTIDPTTGIITGHPTGAEGAVSTASITVDNGTPVTQTVTFKTQTVYRNWANRYFTAEEQNDPVTGGPSASPQKDGVPNRLKQLLGIDPTRPMDAASRTALPIGGRTDDGVNTYVTLTFTIGNNAGPLGNIDVETSTDLIHWQVEPLAPWTYLYDNADFVGSVMQVRAPSTGDARKFIRLKFRD